MGGVEGIWNKGSVKWKCGGMKKNLGNTIWGLIIMLSERKTLMTVYIDTRVDMIILDQLTDVARIER